MTFGRLTSEGLEGDGVEETVGDRLSHHRLQRRAQMLQAPNNGTVQVKKDHCD
jgi:hypothetical protein